MSGCSSPSPSLVVRARRSRSPGCTRAARPTTPTTASSASSPRRTSTATSPQTIGGDDVEVTSDHRRPAQDPHEFEANAARAARALAGRHRDRERRRLRRLHATTMLDAVGQRRRRSSSTRSSSPATTPTADGFNEHVWYDYPTHDRRSSTAIADALRRRSTRRTPRATPADADALDGRARRRSGRAPTLHAAAVDGAGVVITEPVPLYLLEAIGLREPHARRSSARRSRRTPTSRPPCCRSVLEPHRRRRRPRSWSTTRRPAGRRPTPSSTSRPTTGCRRSRVTETLPDGHGLRRAGRTGIQRR